MAAKGPDAVDFFEKMASFEKNLQAVRNRRKGVGKNTSAASTTEASICDVQVDASGVSYSTISTARESISSTIQIDPQKSSKLQDSNLGINHKVETTLVDKVAIAEVANEIDFGTGVNVQSKKAEVTLVDKFVFEERGNDTIAAEEVLVETEEVIVETDANVQSENIKQASIKANLGWQLNNATLSNFAISDEVDARLKQAASAAKLVAPFESMESANIRALRHSKVMQDPQLADLTGLCYTMNTTSVRRTIQDDSPCEQNIFRKGTLWLHERCKASLQSELEALLRDIGEPPSRYSRYHKKIALRS